ncbi:Uncharacterised protein [Helicobacter pametensis]|nr:Uncharacterised protein [Helicobacter pametensis]
MNPKIAHLQQRNAQVRLRQRYSFLNIADIQSTDGDIAHQFVDKRYLPHRPPGCRCVPVPSKRHHRPPAPPSPAPSRPRRNAVPGTRLACRYGVDKLKRKRLRLLGAHFPPCRPLWIIGLNNTTISRCILKTAMRWPSMRRSMNGNCWKRRADRLRLPEK